MAVWALLSGIVLGAVLGFIFQRGRYCLNTAFRDILYIKNFTLFRSYLLSLVIAMLGSNLLEGFGLIRLDEGRLELAWFANAVGGYLFGIGMVMAGGCAAGTWYRTGEGLVGSWMAALGFMIGVAAVSSGVLSGLYAALRSGVFTPSGPITIDGLLGIGRWWIIIPFSVLALFFIFMARIQYSPARYEYNWRTAGVLVGVVILLSWIISDRTSGTATGISLTAPSERLLLWAASGWQWDWGTAVLVGIPLGAFISSRTAHEFSWRAPRASTMVQQLLGGLIMGIGGGLAGGCLIGHGLTGLSALSLASLVATVFMVFGAWTMVYLLFMRSSS